MGLRRNDEVVAHDAELHACALVHRVEREDLVLLLREIDDDRLVDGLAREPGPAATRDDRCAELAARRDGGDDVGPRLRDDDGEGHPSIIGCIVRVHRAATPIEANLAPNRAPERGLEPVKARLTLARASREGGTGKVIGRNQRVARKGIGGRRHGLRSSIRDSGVRYSSAGSTSSWLLETISGNAASSFSVRRSSSSARRRPMLGAPDRDQRIAVESPRDAVGPRTGE